MVIYLQHDEESPRKRVAWSQSEWPVAGDGLKYHELHVLDDVQPEDVVEAVLQIEDPWTSTKDRNAAIVLLRSVTVDSTPEPIVG